MEGCEGSVPYFDESVVELCDQDAVSPASRRHRYPHSVMADDSWLSF